MTSEVMPLTIATPEVTLGNVARSASTAKKHKKAREAAPDDVRARVLGAAMRLIDEGGLASLSMREVARAAGVSHQAPYHWFADREAILAAMAEEGFRLLTDRLEAATVPGSTAGEHIESLGRAYVQFACDHPSEFRLMFRPDFVDHARFPALLACGERAFSRLPDAIQRCVAEGLPLDPSFEAHVVLAWSTVHGLACLVLDGPLAKKVPRAATARDTTIDDTMRALRLLVEARMHAKAPPRDPSRAKKRR